MTLTNEHKAKIQKSVETGNLELLKQQLQALPIALATTFHFGKGQSGLLLNMAAYYDNPKIIRYLVQEKRVNINERVGNFALHHACAARSYAAVATLLKLGANKNLMTSSDINSSNILRGLFNIYDPERRGEYHLDSFTAAIVTGNLDYVEKCLAENRDCLVYGLVADKDFGFPLHIAAIYNQCAIIKYLVKEKMDAINKQVDDTLYTPLHFACKNDAVNAIGQLLHLKADTMLLTAKGESPLRLCQSDKARNIIINYNEKSFQPRVEGFWHLSGPATVVHDYEDPNARLRLVDTFNFEARYWKTVTQDIDSKSIAQNTFLFDDMNDQNILHQAHEKYTSLNGQISADAIYHSVTYKKRPGIKI